jgi:hypothetical protein
MNPIEEKIWSYIDGTCTAEEKQAIDLLITTDDAYRRKYEEISAFNKELEAMELDAPPMAFTYKVMEGIRTETAQKPLKAAIDTRIIKGIVAFFCITITALIAVALYNANWTDVTSNSGGIKMPDNINLSAVSLSSVTGYFNGPALKAFLFFDVVLAMFLLDTYLRRKNSATQHN